MTDNVLNWGMPPAANTNNYSFGNQPIDWNAAMQQRLTTQAPATGLSSVGLSNQAPALTWANKGGWGQIAGGLNAAANVGNAFIGLKQLGQANKMFNFQKNAWNLDYKNRAMEYNDRAAARNQMLQKSFGEGIAQRRLINENPKVGG